MKKCNDPEGSKKLWINNPVAKYAHVYNKAHIFDDRKKYNRKLKHKGREVILMILSRIIRITFRLVPGKQLVF